MRKIMKLYLALALVLSLCACSNKEELPIISATSETEDPFVIGGGSETTMLSYKFGLIDFPENCTYSGKPVEFDMYYQNGSFEVETGFLIFVNGIPQTYLINDQDESSIMHKFDLAAGERQVIHVSFVPNTGKKGDVMNLQFASMLEPSYVTNQNENYGNNHRLLELTPSTLTFETDSNGKDFSEYSIEKTELIDQDIIDRYSLTSASAADTHMLKLYDTFADVDIFSVDKGSVLLTLEDFGGAGAEYRTTIFIDNIPIKIENKYDYAEYYLKEGNYIRQEIKIPVDNSEDKHSVYAVSVPVDTNSSGNICISNSSTIFPIGTVEIIPEKNSEQQPELTGNTDISSHKNVKELSDHFSGTVSFCEMIDDNFYTVENYNSIVKYSSDFQKIKSVDFSEDQLFLEARAIDNGVAVFSQHQDGNGMLCTIYDSDLNALEKNIFSLMGIDPNADYISFSEIDISNDGKSIIYAGYNESGESCIYRCATDTAEKTLMYTDNELSIVNVRYTQDGNVAYTADSYASGTRREFVGIISASGQKLVQQDYDNSEYSGSSQNKVLFDERNVKDGDHSSGKIFVLSSGGESKEIILNSSDESQHAYLSPSGNDIVTYCEEENCCSFSVYDNGKVCAEWSIEYPESTNAYVSNVSFANDRRIIVVVSAGMQQKIFGYEF